MILLWLSLVNAVFINGTYENLLGSTMIIRCMENGNGAIIQGDYASGVGIGWHPLVGQSTSCSAGANIAWTVVWTDAVTAWTGQVSTKPPLIIESLWILNTNAQPTDYWKSNQVGADYFWQT